MNVCVFKFGTSDCFAVGCSVGGLSCLSIGSSRGFSKLENAVGFDVGYGFGSLAGCMVGNTVGPLGVDLIVGCLVGGGLVGRRVGGLLSGLLGRGVSGQVDGLVGRRSHPLVV